jgi:hypothetical protein
MWSGRAEPLRGDIANLYPVGPGLLKLARDPADNDLMRREAAVLTQLRDQVDPRFAAAMGHRDRVRDAAGAIASQLEAADCVLGLAVVLDDEPLVVLDHTSGRGFRLTMSGVGDNFQLHTLLADRLTGNSRPGLLSLEPPPHAWVTAATDGPVKPPDGDPIFRRFRLFDGHGAYVYPEGRPADIAPLDDTRVLVLYPPLGPFGWTGGRFYQHMTPTLTLDRVMDSATATSWLARIAPADQSDLMASNGQ